MKKKRFIAGASCLICKGFDCVYTFERDEQKYRGCSHCDFEEIMSFGNALPAKTELETRVNKQDEEAITTVISFDPKT